MTGSRLESVNGSAPVQGLRSTRGILHAQEGLRRFELRRRLPSPAVAGLVSHYWIVSWDLRGHEPHTHPHRHEALRHRHPHYPDLHHRHTH